MKASWILATAAIAATIAPAASVSAAENANTKATVNVVTSEEDGTLELKSAPDFNFGTYKAQDIYDGFSATIATGDNQDLVIVDARPSEQATPWTLSATLGALTDGKTTLNAATIKLSSTATEHSLLNLDGTLATDKNQHLAEQPGRGTQTVACDHIDATLTQTATPNASVAAKTTFTAPLVWTLATTAAQAPAL